MIHLRPTRRDDLEVVDRIWRKHHSDDFGVPSLNNVIDNRVIQGDGRIIGFGMVKLFAEGVIVLDKGVPLPSRAKGIIVSIEHALDSVKRAGLEQFHVFTDDPHYIEVLQRHWGFRTAPGTVLYKEIE
jgi:hypothetical protein